MGELPHFVVKEVAEGGRERTNRHEIPMERDALDPNRQRCSSTSLCAQYTDLLVYVTNYIMIISEHSTPDTIQQFV